jgi:molybdenum cofactor biosynthesis enzyme MoaA
MLDNLITAGLNSVNISLDTLNEAKYAKITRREGNIFRKVLAGIYRLKYVIYPLN